MTIDEAKRIAAGISAGIFDAENMDTEESEMFGRLCHAALSLVERIRLENFPFTVKKFADDVVKAGERTIKLGLYRHFQGDLYEVLNVAVNPETKERTVVYINRTRPSDFYGIPYDMFVREVDYEEFPYAKQKWRFERVEDREEDEEE